MKNLNLKKIMSPIIEAFRRYHVTIFIVVVVSGLAGSVLILNAILQSSTDISGYKAVVTDTSFDQKTIDRIKLLHESTDSSNATVTSNGRINPFGE